jgi:hypothetical protein
MARAAERGVLEVYGEDAPELVLGERVARDVRAVGRAEAWRDLEPDADDRKGTRRGAVDLAPLFEEFVDDLVVGLLVRRFDLARGAQAVGLVPGGRQVSSFWTAFCAF